MLIVKLGQKFECSFCCYNCIYSLICVNKLCHRQLTGWLIWLMHRAIIWTNVLSSIKSFEKYLSRTITNITTLSFNIMPLMRSPADIWRSNNVIIMSKRRRFNVMLPLSLRHVSAGIPALIWLPFWSREIGSYHIETETILSFSRCCFYIFFFMKKCCIFYSNSTESCPQSLTDHVPALVQILPWCRTGDKPLSEPMIVHWCEDASFSLDKISLHMWSSIRNH